MEIMLTDVYDALHKTLPQEDAKIVTTYLENLGQSKPIIEELRQFIKTENVDIRAEMRTENAKIRTEIVKSKNGTIWALVLLMVPTWTGLIILLYNTFKH
jgi:hypothetical protein